MAVIITKQQLLSAIESVGNDVGLLTAIVEKIFDLMPTEYLDMYVLDMYFRDYAYRDYWALVHRDGHTIYAFTKYEVIGYLLKKFPGADPANVKKVFRKEGNEYFGYHVEKRKGTRPL